MEDEKFSLRERQNRQQKQQELEGKGGKVENI